MSFTNNLEINKKTLLEKFHNNSDIKYRDLSMEQGTKCCFVFLEGAVESECLRDVFSRIMDVKELHENVLEFLSQRIISTYGVEIIDDMDKAVIRILEGNGVLIVEGQKEVLNIGCTQWKFKDISEPPTSSVLRGPREGFTEDVRTNLAMIRRRLRSPDLIYERFNVGRYTNTEVVVGYIKSIADDKIVQKIKERIAQIDIDGIVDSFYIEQFLEEHSTSMLKQTGISEKPDIVTAKLLEGRVAIFVQGSPIVLTLPYMLFEDIQESGDYYLRISRASFLRFLRLFAVFIGVHLPGIYVALQIFHYVALPQEYLLNLMNAIQNVPFTPLIEMLVVVTLFEIIHEASFRMPRYVGMAMSVVGALVLGDTAVKAGLISSPAICFMAISAIALYTVPDQVGIFKLLRLLFIIAGGLAGMFGIILMEIILLAYMTALDNYGTPYLAPYAPAVGRDLGDGLVKTAVTKKTTRPFSFPSKNKKKMRLPDADK